MLLSRSVTCQVGLPGQGHQVGLPGQGHQVGLPGQGHQEDFLHHNQDIPFRVAMEEGAAGPDEENAVLAGAVVEPGGSHRT
mgnify:CR=1 FL=1